MGCAYNHQNTLNLDVTIRFNTQWASFWAKRSLKIPISTAESTTDTRGESFTNTYQILQIQQFNLWSITALVHNAFILTRSTTIKTCTDTSFLFFLITFYKHVVNSSAIFD